MTARDDRPAVVLLSGGLDSTTVLAMARDRGFACHALSFDYGQRHRFELAAAARVAEALGAVEHRIFKLDLSAAGGFGKSALTDNIEVPKDQSTDYTDYTDLKKKSTDYTDSNNGKSAIRNPHGTEGPQSAIPSTYVPARNTIFLSIALAWAETIGAFDIFIGVNAVDYSGYPDCRGEFVEAFEKLANLATAAAVEGRGKFSIHAPLIEMTKGQIIRTGLALGVDYSLTHSCYDPAADGSACERCDACRLRLAGFAEAGAKDPVKYI